MLPPSLSGGVRSCSSFTSQASREDQPQEADGSEMAEEVITAPLWGPGASETLSGVGRLLLCSCQVHWLRAFTMTLTPQPAAHSTLGPGGRGEVVGLRAVLGVPWRTFP